MFCVVFKGWLSKRDSKRKNILYVLAFVTLSIGKSWRRNRDNVATIFAYPKAIRKAIYTTNAINWGYCLYFYGCKTWNGVVFSGFWLVFFGLGGSIFGFGINILWYNKTLSVTFASYDIFFLQNSYKKYTVNEIKQLKKQTKLLSMYSQDASIAEIQRWLLSERIKVNYSTVYRFNW
jgi:hypothetical protein